MRRAIAACTIAAAITGTAACTSDDKHDTPAAPAAAAPGADPRAALEQTVRTYVTALYTPDADAAWAIVSQRCREQLGRTALDSDVRRRADLYGRLTVRSVTVDELSGDRARVSYDVGVPAMAQTRTAWVLAGGAWRWDAC